MLELKDLFAGYNIIAIGNYTVSPSELNNVAHVDRPSVVLKLSANAWIRVTELRRGYYLTFEHVRLQGSFHKDILIGQFSTLSRVRQVINAISEDKSYGIKLSMRYLDPIVSTLVVDPMGNVVRGVNAVRKSEMAELSAQGYSFRSVTNSEQELKSMKKGKRSYAK